MPSDDGKECIKINIENCARVYQENKNKCFLCDNAKYNDYSSG